MVGSECQKNIVHEVLKVIASSLNIFVIFRRIMNCQELSLCTPSLKLPTMEIQVRMLILRGWGKEP